jgi:Fe-S-cluster containining protein
MVQSSNLPEHVHRLAKDETFNFACHKGVSCFTECCRMLELALTPYDVLRLRRATGLSSVALHEKYIIMEQDPGEPFPRFYLTMVDDGRASCVYVTEAGCSVYGHRPAACRTYPLGRAVVRHDDNTLEEHFVLMKENHCRGFSESPQQNADSYSEDQQLRPYNSFNDKVSQILQHQTLRQGFIPSQKQVQLFTLALYDIDNFRAQLENDQIDSLSFNADEKRKYADDELLLDFAIDWITKELFSLTAPK